MLDFERLASTPVITVHIKHPVAGLIYDDKEKKKPSTVEFYMDGSNEHRSAAIERMVEAQAYIDMYGEEDKSKQAVESLERIERRFLLKILKSVKNIHINKKKATPSTFINLLNASGMGWMHEFLEAELKDDKNRFPNA